MKLPDYWLTRPDIDLEIHHKAFEHALLKPAFKVAVQPKDFPFLERIHAYDEEDLATRVREDPNGFPWIE